MCSCLSECKGLIKGFPLNKVHKGIQSQLSFKGRKLQRSDLMRQSLKQQAMRINASLLDCKFL